jgi:nickel transport protein
MMHLPGDASAAYEAMIQRSFWLPILMAALFLSAGPAHAHKVNMFAMVEGDRVVVQGYFPDGKKALNSKVEVFDPAGNKVAEGTTSSDGMYAFKVPLIADLRITLNAGMGHRAEYTLTKAELAGVKVDPGAPANGKAGEDSRASSTIADAQAALVTANTSADGSNANIPPDEMDTRIRKAVGEAMLPVVRSLSELKEARSFSDIVGGIGFIVGIIGVFFYLKARKMLENHPASAHSDVTGADKRSLKP